MEDRIFQHRKDGWVKEFPYKGAVLMDFLEPFYDWRPGLKPAIPDLAKIAEKAIPLRKAKRVRTVRPPLKSSSVSSLALSFRPPLRELLASSYEIRLFTLLGHELRPQQFMFWSLFGHELDELIWQPVKDSIFRVCLSILADTTLRTELKPLHDLWFAGNFPVGFDKRESLVVLVAD